MKEHVVFDTELVGPDDGPVTFLFCAKHLPSGKVASLWGDNPEDMSKLQKLFNNPNFTWVSFNGIRFDAPIVTAVLGGIPLTQVKRMANRLIAENVPAWMIYRDYNLEAPEIDHIDLIEVAPGVMVSLKTYQARLKMKTIRDMPSKHDDALNEHGRRILNEYCLNDVDATAALFAELGEAVSLREHMSEEYRIDLRSKSDAQMAEAIIAKSLGIMRAGPAEIPNSVKYKAPEFIAPRGPIMQDILRRAEKHRFGVHQGNGAVILPDFLANEQVLIGDGSYQMGIGGLHSTHDKSVFVEAGPDYEIVDADVASFYPNLILNANMIPRGLGHQFITLYRNIVKQRMVAKKRTGEIKKRIDEIKKRDSLVAEKAELEKELAIMKVKTDSGKLQANGTFGKLGSMFSKLYAPDLMLAVTLTGQFYLLTLIEDLNDLGVKVISANTDGVCFSGTPERVKAAKDWIECYGALTGFEFEFTPYRKIALKDVNNYLAVTMDGKVKPKGIYANAGLMKNPTNEVCTLAAQAYLATGRSIESFIREHLTVANFVDFTQARSVKGGAVVYGRTVMFDDWVQIADRQWQRPGTTKIVNRVSRPHPVALGVDPTYLGRTVRWYYSTDRSLTINYANNGNLVPKSEGGRECMTLPDRIPDDIDISRYIEETRTNLANMGVYA